ncbi:flagellar assembly protein FliW [Clostridium botulinum]|uniref:Flagellar assembly factor FliW n=1 Tax=Clostridium botulinum (strain Okra / Type B1) TaxID=498213 RepID=FLIW_CLOBK|nr:flagellar assembly protein FliW [Clostridium botulinum]B1IK66.1 RecName: Full=Flagellar assembly factor FliW [Clostridium botulinum B1 str. Okra]EKX80786.1 flagellar assembly protein FliW [Clostridium botulinum CFSAN001628]ACA46736.1 flagellar assembly factor FliW [Clostridium botulinum B1 str. Okra]MBD5562211.1 flagellar assembly protein FliW [Clostridium botulinum]MBD5567166.1 flagellar assembly protein FliW [Clostridium botulinum]MBD5570221.1 flagellar assembly protein FliW [Clostridium
MNLNTKYHGCIEYEEKDVIYFEKGIPGFEELKKFIIFPVEDNDVFSVFHSIEKEDMGIIVISPFNIEKDYEIQLEEEQRKKLELQNEKDALVLNTVTLNSDIDKITVNLRAPIIINIKEKIGEQIIINSDKYKVKHPLFKEEA